MQHLPVTTHLTHALWLNPTTASKLLLYGAPWQLA
jgi:hypothetical protein